MAISPPKIPIHTYHCLCSTLLFASTHQLSLLPTRSTDNGGLDGAIILPLPSVPSTNTNTDTDNDNDASTKLPAAGSTTAVNISADRKVTLVRREDGFEKRVLWRCGRCRLVVGYELVSSRADGEAMDIDSAGASGAGKGKGKDKEEYTGKVLYVLPGGVMSTDVMMAQTRTQTTTVGAGRKIGEDDVDIKRGGTVVFE